jgi:hypothetical protein
VSYGHGGAWWRKFEHLKSQGGQGLHNKRIGCGASGAYAPGPDDKEEEEGWGVGSEVLLEQVQL